MATAKFSDTQSSMGLGAGFSVKVNTEIPTSSTQTLNPTLTEKESTLNLNDLFSSSEEKDDDDEDGVEYVRELSGGCTGEPRQKPKEVRDYNKIDEKRLLGAGVGIFPDLSKQGSQASVPSSSEANDQVHPMMKFKKTRSMMPKFDHDQFSDNSFNEVLPRQF